MWSFIKRYKYVVGCLFLSLLCAISIYLQDGYIDKNSMLVEAFSQYYYLGFSLCCQ